MEITEIKIFPVREEKLRAFVSIVLDGCFMVNDIKVINGKDGLFISMPSRRKKNGRFKDIAHPLNNETRQAMESKIVAEYQRMLGTDEEVRRQPRAAAATQAPAPKPEPAPAPKAASGSAKDERDPEVAAEDDGKSLEEIHEAHLRDSYWTT